MRDGAADNLFHILLIDFRTAVGTIDDRRDARLGITRPQRCRHAPGIANGREFLIGDDHDVRGIVETVEHGQVRARDVENRVGVLRRGELDHRAQA